MSISRGEHYQKFGPLRDEAAELVMLGYINILRKEQGMPELTQQDFLELIENHLAHLEPYPWIKKEP